MKRKGPVNTKIMPYLKAHVGEEVHIDDIVAATGLEHKQVVNGMYTLSKTTRITKPRQGWYIYRGPGRSSSTRVNVKAKVTLVLLLEGDRILIECEGKLYVATELDVG